jgi:hypothetical protein
MSGTYPGIGQLNYTPDNKFCYFYSGEFTASSSLLFVGEFKTRSEYIVGEVRLAGMTDMGSPASGSIVALRVVFGDTTTSTLNAEPELVVANLKTDGASEDMPFSDTAKIIVPPFTNVQFFRDGDTTSTSYDGTVSFTGQVFGSIEQFNLEQIK